MCSLRVPSRVGFSQFIEQGVGLAVEYAVTLLDGGLADGLSQVTFAGAGWTEKQGVFVPGDKSAGGQIEDQAAIHLLVEGEVEVIGRWNHDHGGRPLGLSVTTTTIQPSLHPWPDWNLQRCGETLILATLSPMVPGTA
jgi:hypothetical protein